jgi:hypothetical protein
VTAAVPAVTDIPRRPRFNHVAMTLPASALDERGRADIVTFYNDVFGWTEVPTLTVDRERLVLRVYEMGQFVYILGAEEHLVAPPSDHFGIQVDTVGELDAMLAVAKAWRERDPRVEIIDREVEDHTRVVLTSFYVRYLLPLMIEVQHYQVPAAAPA